jgi:hypothetical protein
VQISRLGKVLVFLVMGLASACGLDDSAGPPVSSVSSAVTCNPFMCGDNAATGGDQLVFDELDLFHKPNYAHVRMLGAMLPATGGSPPMPIQLGIDHDWLFGVDPSGVRHEGSGLQGTIIKMLYQDQKRQEVFELRIEQVDMNSIHFVAGADEVVPTYLIKSRRRGENQFNFFVCNNDILPIDPTWAAAPHHALVFRGDRYHPTQKRVYDLAENDPWDPNNGWSFLACAGSAAAKMHLYRHTFAGGFLRASPGWAPFMTSIPQRTILMKTITADYCGNGVSYTENGTPLVFDVNPGFATTPLDLTLLPGPPPPPPSPPGGWGVRSYEAVWVETGVVCLDETRRQRFGGQNRDQVERECRRPIPTCASLIPWLPWTWQSFGYSVTANPW